jgi:hypothetical protein
MKRILIAVLLSVCALAVSVPALAQPDEPVVYVIKKGDTLWGLSDRFLNDPFYWPNLWARNPKITNPHLIFPGQKIKIYPDRIEIEPMPAEEAPTPAVPQIAKAKAPVTEAAKEQAITVIGSEGFILEKKISPSGYIIVTNNDRLIVGTGDIVYTDIGKNSGAKTGDRFSVFKEMGPVKHPVTGAILGNRVESLGTIKLTDLENKNSKAVITKAYQEIGSGSYLTPYHNPKREIYLKAASRNLRGYIVAARHDIITTGAGEIVYLDLGKRQGLETGNLLYVVQDIKPNKLYRSEDVGELPQNVIGAVVVVDTGENTSTALIVKSVQEIHKGDKVVLNKN